MCKNCDNSQEHVINDHAKTEKRITKLIRELNYLDTATKNKNTFGFYFLLVL